MITYNIINFSPTGYYQNEQGSSTCFPCIAGRYNNHTRQSSCINCNPNRFAKAPIALQCLDCPTGYASPKLGGFLCSQCAAGRYHDLKLQICEQCPQAWYQSSRGADKCVICPTGYLNNYTNQPACGTFFLFLTFNNSLSIFSLTSQFFLIFVQHLAIQADSLI